MIAEKLKYGIRIKYLWLLGITCLLIGPVNGRAGWLSTQAVRQNATRGQITGGGGGGGVSGGSGGGGSGGSSGGSNGGTGRGAGTASPGSGPLSSFNTSLKTSTASFTTKKGSLTAGTQSSAIATTANPPPPNRSTQSLQPPILQQTSSAANTTTAVPTVLSSAAPLASSSTPDPATSRPPVANPPVTNPPSTNPTNAATTTPAAAITSSTAIPPQSTQPPSVNTTVTSLTQPAVTSPTQPSSTTTETTPTTEAPTTPTQPSTTESTESTTEAPTTPPEPSLTESTSAPPLQQTSPVLPTPPAATPPSIPLPTPPPIFTDAPSSTTMPETTVSGAAPNTTLKAKLWPPNAKCTDNDKNYNLTCYCNMLVASGEASGQASIKFGPYSISMAAGCGFLFIICVGQAFWLYLLRKQNQKKPSDERVEEPIKPSVEAAPKKEGVPVAGPPKAKSPEHDKTSSEPDDEPDDPAEKAKNAEAAKKLDKTRETMGKLREHVKKIHAQHEEDAKSKNFKKKGPIFIPMEPEIPPPNNNLPKGIKITKVTYDSSQNERYEIGSEVDDVEMDVGLTLEPPPTLSEDDTTRKSVAKPVTSAGRTPGVAVTPGVVPEPAPGDDHFAPAAPVVHPPTDAPVLKTAPGSPLKSTKSGGKDKSKK